ncbi:hypothetical protein [Antrihabitans sp. YC2-6]|uniref:hypothetical protein n=1 Tax=Antrihabitans sp. YC2-6 TaxID=2799498 RepID=UPI0018F77853|nr:hypothetical protein [Antrihabitans sp. YC2-6]MBJ8348862.1 hypothetical protein [Antrihabitans sp. YC2-6]
MTEQQRCVLSRALADDCDFCEPTEREIADLAAYVAGTITADEFEQRAEWRMVGASY